jgi:hypothetical protein
MKGVTRERPTIDRIACPWLIARYIDQAPEFLYAPADKVLETAEQTGATPYDIPALKWRTLAPCAASTPFSQSTTCGSLHCSNWP